MLGFCIAYLGLVGTYLFSEVLADCVYLIVALGLDSCELYSLYRGVLDWIDLLSDIGFITGLSYDSDNFEKAAE